MDWHNNIVHVKEELLEDLSGLLRIESINDPSSFGGGQPMGRGIAEALQYMLDLSAASGFKVHNHDGYFGYAEYGPESAADYIAVLCHLDVVPVSGKWTTPPFEPSIRDGKIFARGAIDDKGPTMAAFYALKQLKDSGLPLKHRVRLIFGTDEELTSRCMDKYRQVEPMPLCGFTPDADFPIVRAEKGQINTRILLTSSTQDQGQPVADFKLMSFAAGGVANMVPESAKAELLAESGRCEELQRAYASYCEAHKLVGTVEVTGKTVTLSIEGKAAHGMEPHLGVNAGLMLLHFLKDCSLQPEAQRYVNSLDAFLYGDVYGNGLGIAMEDESSGPLTVNTGIMQYQPGGESFFHINLRFPICGTTQDILARIQEKTSVHGWEIEEPILKNPHHVPDDHPMILALQRVYEEETGQSAELLSTGGGTYGAHIPNGVAFGPIFPGMEYTAHQQDEYMEINVLLQAASIYARAMYELANLDA